MFYRPYIYIFVSWCVGGSKASDCVTNQLLPGLQMVCNTVMSLIKISVCPLIDQRPKAVPGYTFNKKWISTQLSQQKIRYVNTTSPRRLNMLSETKYNTRYNTHASFALCSLKLACTSSDRYQQQPFQLAWPVFKERYTGCTELTSNIIMQD